MVTDVKDVSPWKNRLMLAAAVLAFLAGVVGFHTAGDQQTLMGLGLLLMGVVAAAVLGLVSPSGREFIGFAKESQAEARRVHWPTRKETGQMTGVVFLFVLVMAVFLWLTDKSLEWVLYDLLLGWKR
jgi:preprotein translocase subunit SecE